MINKNITAICIMTLLTGCSTMFTGTEVRDKLNSSAKTVINPECIGEWQTEILDYNDSISEIYFNNMNFNSYKLTNDTSDKQGILLMHGTPEEKIHVEAVLSKTEAIITFGDFDQTLYYFNTKSVKKIKQTPAFYDGQWITIENNVCMALDKTKTYSYQTAVGIRTVQNVTLIPRYIKNNYYKTTKQTSDIAN